MTDTPGDLHRNPAAEHAERFTHLRPLLFTIAYEILGTATESDDVLQESYLRWAQVDLAGVQDTKEYVGPWLPEPLLIDAGDASSDVVLAESVSMAMMVVLETLSPDERAVFVLREVFGFGHDEIATTIGKSTAAVRQMAHRAREHVQSRRKRFEPVDPKRSLELTAQFFATASTGDIDSLITMLAPDVVWTADSDGKASAARKPVAGAERVARLVLGLFRVAGDEGRVEPAFYNGAPAMVLYLGDNLEGVVLVEITDGMITHFYAMRNPEKLGGVKVTRELSR